MKIKQMAERLNNISVRKKAKKLLALTLAVLIINSVTGYSVAAQTPEAQTPEAQAITGFAKLPVDITAQKLALNAEESQIHFPHTLEVTIDTAETNTVEQSQPDKTIADDSSVSGNNEQATQDETSGEEDDTSTNSNPSPILDSEEDALVHSQ